MPPYPTVDVVIRHPEGIVLVRRANPPFRGCFALPGGFVEDDETVEEAARREVLEETGLEVRLVDLVGVYSGPGRDPRGPTLSVAFLGEVVSGRPTAGSDAAEVHLFPPDKLPDLAFDHERILREALSGDGRKGLE